MTTLLLKLLGRCLAALPVPVVAGFAALAGDLIYLAPSRRRRDLLRNLHHALPGTSEPQRRRIGRISCRRMVEMGLFVVASPFFSQERVRRVLALDPEAARLARVWADDGLPRVFLCPHFNLMEVLTLWPAVSAHRLPEMGVIYRPQKNPGLEAWIHRARSRFGFRLLSRKQGFAQALGLLRRGNWAAILFDQNASAAGTLTWFCGRAASTTELPGLMVQKFGARPTLLWPERRGFWRARLHLTELPVAPTAPAVTRAMNAWLEDQLTRRPDLSATWLWMHNRWKTQQRPEVRFRIEAKKVLPPEGARLEPPLGSWPRRTVLLLRLPDRLDRAIQALPALRALRIGRPDFDIQLLAPTAWLPILARLDLADRLVSLPPGRRAARRVFRSLRHLYPDIVYHLGGIRAVGSEARASGAPQRFGIATKPLPRGLTHAFDPGTVPAGTPWPEVVASACRHFGLRVEPDRRPVTPVPCRGASAEGDMIGLWLPPGTGLDPDSLAAAIRDGLPGATVRPLPVGLDAGSLRDLAQAMTACDRVVAAPGHGLQLANLLGRPVLVPCHGELDTANQPAFAAPWRPVQPERGAVIAALQTSH